MKGRRILGIGLAVMVVVGVAVAAVGEWPSGAGLELVGDEALVAGEMFWDGSPEPSERLVTLKKSTWSCVNPGI